MTVDDLEDVWRALASPLRRRILDLLRDGPRTTGDLAAALPDVSRFAVMQHIAVLESADLVIARRSDRERWNHLNPVPIRRIHERWVSRYQDLWAAELESLRVRAEGAVAPVRPSSRRPSKEKIREPRSAD